ncbi:DUF2799 domain-containing protein [Vibrio aquaticus]|uniref:DUF2799 domain-containing protein n=1 Tax=Vibrio aquaticus TaxID=2496559 RepID=A0A3S0N3J7_9VIBR|nr:DUF2799 domain-containing protein [Vibrio aquaticus]RTZ14289.1 DUF2799 domain-containing protein [Vibrio aquaticus]
MKYLLVVMAILLAGCASQPAPMTSIESDWSDYGQQRAEQGYLKQSESRLAKLDTQGYLTPELYSAYQDGYEAGREVYCEQSAYMLGVMGKPYLGICDKLNPFFQQDYVSGKTSTAGSMF